MVTLENTGLFWKQHKTQNTTHRHSNHQDEPCHLTHNFHFSFLVKCEFSESAQIQRELAPHYFPTLFWRQLTFGGNWLHIFFWQIVLEAAQIWRELAPHYFPVDCFGNLDGTGSTLFPADCFGGSSNLAGTGSTLFSDRYFWRQLKFGRNWLHIIF